MTEILGQHISEGRKPSYWPGLDGLRAVAIIPVMLYHAPLARWQGGFLGVDVFFAISGYLITSLILAEYDTRGTISLKAFWIRRARRLLPALYLTLAVTITYAVLFLPDARQSLRGNVVAALGYVTNWYQVFAGESYLEISGRSPLLGHLWSLAVEEQFYLVWPLVLFVALKSRIGRRSVAVASTGFAIASAAWMSHLYSSNQDDPANIFVRTDTRATGILLGAALAFVWSPNNAAKTALATKRLLLTVTGTVAFGALLYSYLNMNDFEPWIYRGGWVLIDLVAITAIAVAIHPGSIWSRVLAVRPLRYIGTRSYGLYMWHMPIFLITRPGVDIPITGNANLLLRFVLTFAITEVSYRWVESPIRHGSIGRFIHAYRTSHIDSRALTRRRLLALLLVVAVPITALSFELFFTPLPQLSGSEAALATPICPPRQAKTALALGSTSMVEARDQLKRAMPTMIINASVDRALPETLQLLRDIRNGDEFSARSMSPQPGIVVIELNADDSFDDPIANVLTRETATYSTVILIATRGIGQLKEIRRATSADPRFVVLNQIASIRSTGWISSYVARVSNAIQSVAGSNWDVSVPERQVDDATECLAGRDYTALAIGDSVMDRARSGLVKELPAMFVLAAGNRTIPEARALIVELLEQDSVPEIVVIHLGTARPFADKDFRDFAGLLKDVDHVFFVNSRSQLIHEPQVNSALEHLVPQFENATLIDWRNYSNSQSDWFSDGIHLTELGAQKFAAFLDSQIAAKVGADWQPVLTQ